MALFDRHKTHLHFVGIGGIGMSGLAEVFFNQGYQVSGSDLQQSDATLRLAKMGLRISRGHLPEHVEGAHVVIISSAVDPGNPEIKEARRLHIPVIPRAEMLGELMRGKIGIAVAGTHGKTTTTSMLASVLTAAGQDPTLVIGGKVNSLGGNAKLGAGRCVVAEADESDGSFLHLPATLAVVTNIDADHLDHFKSLEAIDDAFARFIAKLPFYGAAVVCAEDPGVKRNLTRWTKPYVTYGFSGEWDVSAQNVFLEPLGSRFKVHVRNMEGPDRELGEIHLNVPGRHNVLNSLGAVAIALKLQIPFEKIQEGLDQFGGVHRRFEILHHDQARKIALIDDYGHHPAEISATLAAARNFWKGRIICAFQPHRYSRTLHAREGFISAFQDADSLFLCDVYPAGEKPIAGATSEDLYEEMNRRSGMLDLRYVPDLDQMGEKILHEIKDGDLVLCFGAGSITQLARKLHQRLLFPVLSSEGIASGDESSFGGRAP